MNETSTMLIENAPKVIGKSQVLWGGDDPFTHTLIIGPTRCGKTSTVLLPAVHEMLLERKRGGKVGFTVIEPKGDLVKEIYEIAVGMGMKDDVVFLDPTDENSHKFNVMFGDEETVVEATVAVLKSMFGKTEEFFGLVQEASTRNVVALLKRLYKNNMDILTVLDNLRDLSVLKASLDSYKIHVNALDEITKFIEFELLGTGQMAEKYRQFITGLRVQLTNLVSNGTLRKVITGYNSDLNIDRHLEEGKILLVNTAMGLLGNSGDAFGTFISMHMQLGTFRRKGSEFTRIPHYLIIDEYAQYINPDVVRFLSVAASYRVAFIGALQSFSQLEVAAGDKDAKTIRNAIINTARNKIVFGGVEFEDAEYASKIMTAEDIESRSYTFDGGIIPQFIPKSYRSEKKTREKFTPTFFMTGMPKFHCVCKMMFDGVQREPFLAKGEWIPRNWKELSEEKDDLLNKKEEEKIAILLENRPSFFKWRERAYYDVQIDKLNKRIAARERLKDVKSVEEELSSYEEEVLAKRKDLERLRLNSQEKIDGAVPQQNMPSIQRSEEENEIIFNFSDDFSFQKENIEKTSEKEITKQPNSSGIQDFETYFSNDEIQKNEIDLNNEVKVEQEDDFFAHL